MTPTIERGRKLRITSREDLDNAIELAGSLGIDADFLTWPRLDRHVVRACHANNYSLDYENGILKIACPTCGAQLLWLEIK